MILPLDEANGEDRQLWKSSHLIDTHHKSECCGMVRNALRVLVFPPYDIPCRDRFLVFSLFDGDERLISCVGAPFEAPLLASNVQSSRTKNDF
jgi:hypothetical protein